MPNANVRRIHSHIRTVSVMSGQPSELAWAQVLQDEKWWGEDPACCCICRSKATEKWNGKGYCHAHHSHAVTESKKSTDSLIGRYTRFARAGRLNFGRSLVSRYLPENALAEAVQV